MSSAGHEWVTHERDGWSVCSRCGMVRNYGERREEPCDELRRRWRLARDFDQARVYTGRWGAIQRGSVWPVAEVNEDA